MVFTIANATQAFGLPKVCAAAIFRAQANLNDPPASTNCCVFNQHFCVNAASIKLFVPEAIVIVVSRTYLPF